jgi:hypothetical protein
VMHINLGKPHPLLHNCVSFVGAVGDTAAISHFLACSVCIRCQGKPKTLKHQTRNSSYITTVNPPPHLPTVPQTNTQSKVQTQVIIDPEIVVVNSR